MIKPWMAVAGAALLLAGCGGGGGGGETAPPPEAANEVPAAALVSTAALVDWSNSLPPSDTATPLDLKKAVPPTSETEEPREL